MTMRCFRPKNFKPDSEDKIEACNKIIEEYQDQGHTLTLRQLYYQLVSRDMLSNTEKSYKGLSTLVSDARLAGVMDWEAIEDRGRVAKMPSDFADLNELIAAALGSYRLPRWMNQENYVELWVEKDALAGVLAPIARAFHIVLMVNKGYSSQSAMYESAGRFISQSENDDFAKTCTLLYLGDFDPSGEDMVRDISSRLEMFEATVEVQKIALTREQIKKYNPPPNPAKITDPRAANYIAQHGDKSWEVDALPPEVLTKLIKAELSTLRDEDLFQSVIDQEESDKKLLRAAVQSLRKGKK